ncbi:M12 family metallopeptidase [Deinococcus planocerae]|uniref:M12 family metallopeptidase n=1 Tax=Deinococcus planocerae TaxID=1737569 RepID=UPI0015E10E11|nr:FG-GAP-like repeat-containing protein [Deinococcus planocerae]
MHTKTEDDRSWHPLALLGPLMLAACAGSPDPAPAPGGETRQLTLRGKTVTVDVVGEYATVEGDIIVGKLADLERGKLSPQSVFRDAPVDYRWPGGVVPFAFEASVTALGRQNALAAMRAWEAVTPVRFVARSTEADFINFQAGTQADWCFSSIGRQGGQQAVLMTSSGDCSAATLTHELGHTIGLWHEQTREDRSHHINIQWANLRDGLCRSAFEEKHIADGLDIGAYDLNSLMHYDRFGCSVNGNPVYDSIPSGLPMNGGERISPLDRAAVDWLHLRNWIVSDGGARMWRNFGGSGHQAADLATGDFNGDGRTDLFTVDTSRCLWFVATSQGNVAAPWVTLSSGKCEGLDVLRLGDFDGDRKTDVFVSSGGTWWLSRGGVDWWTELNTSSVAPSQLGFGDFDGDGRTDVFYGNGRAWFVSYGGATPWQRVQTSALKVPGLRFGDFDGDGRTDVFRTTNGTWWVSSGATEPWAELNTSSAPLSALKFGDFDGDRRTDIYRTDAQQGWIVSSGGSGPWTPLPDSLRMPPFTAPPSGFVFGDFDGDGRRDVLGTLR